MSLQVYFDGTLIDEKYYTGLSTNNQLFNESFRLGTTACATYTLKIAKEGVSEQPTQITLKNNNNIFAVLEVDNIEEEDYEYVYTLTDKMIDLEFRYDASEIFVNGSTTLYNIVADICSKVGLTLGTPYFYGYNKIINWYDNTRTAREYIGFVAELNSGFARIENNTLYFRKQNNINEDYHWVISLDKEIFENYKLGEKHKITRVVYQLGTLKYEFGDETGETLYLNSDNVFITEESEVQAIYSNIKNFEFYSFETDGIAIDVGVGRAIIQVGDIFTIIDENNNEYPVIAQYEAEYFGNWIGGYHLNINTEKQEETKLIGDKDRIRDIKITVDRQNNEISQVISEVDEQNQKISSVTQTVSELNSKIQDIADITTQAETIYAKLEFTNINQSEPIEIMIHPTTTNITYTYPYNNIFPSNTTYIKNRILRFTNTREYIETQDVYYSGNKKYYYYDDTEYILLVAGLDYTIGEEISDTVYENYYVEYELPDDLLISQNGIYDEFYLGYDEQICQITKRCGYNADGSIYELTNERIDTYTFPYIPLTDGDYTIELLSYNNGYMGIRLMTSNIYTTQFASKVELKSEISQTADEINLSVDEKLYSYPTKTEMNSSIQIKANEINSVVSTKVGNNEVISRINQTAEQIQIDANKISLAGKTINLSADNVAIASDNCTIDKNGNLTCNNANVTGRIVATSGSFSGDVNIYSGNELTVYNSSGYRASMMDRYGLNFYNNVGSYYGRATAGEISYNGTTYRGVTLQPSSGGALTVTPNVTICSTSTGIIAYNFIKYSLEEMKKDIKEYNDNALNIIKNSKLYKFKYKEQENNYENIGFIIGEGYETPEDVISSNKDGIDTDKITSILWKAVQEQQEQIEQLQNKIKELKGE